MAVCYKHPANQDLVRAAGGVALVLQLLGDQAGVLEAGTSLNFGVAPPEATRVVETQSATLCAYAAGFLASVAEGSDASREVIFNGGGVGILLRALETCLQSPHVVANACVAVAHLAYLHEPSQRAARAQGGVVSIIGALLAYRGRGAVQGSICRAIAVLSEGPCSFNQQAFLAARLPDGAGETDVVALLLQALHGAPEDPALVTTASWALANLVRESPEACERLRAQRGCETIVSLLNGPVARQERPCQYLCRLLGRLCEGGTQFAHARRNRITLLSLGAADLIRILMTRHELSQGGEFLSSAREALRKLFELTSERAQWQNGGDCVHAFIAGSRTLPFLAAFLGHSLQSRVGLLRGRDGRTSAKLMRPPQNPSAGYGSTSSWVRDCLNLVHEKGRPTTVLVHGCGIQTLPVRQVRPTPVLVHGCGIQTLPVRHPQEGSSYACIGSRLWDSDVAGASVRNLVASCVSPRDGPSYACVSSRLWVQTLPVRQFASDCFLHKSARRFVPRVSSGGSDEGDARLRVEVGSRPGGCRRSAQSQRDAMTFTEHFVNAGGEVVTRAVVTSAGMWIMPFDGCPEKLQVSSVIATFSDGYVAVSDKDNHRIQFSAVYALAGAFTAIKANGSGVTWGDARHGGNSSAVAPLLTEGVVQVCGNRAAFAAIKANGSVVTWGNALFGGNSSAVALLLTEGVVQVRGTDRAFTAIKANGSVVTWGDAHHGGNSSVVASLLTEGVAQVYGNRAAFAAIKADGSGVTWGCASHGTNSSAVAPLLTECVVQLCGNISAFAAIKADGSVVTWGSAGHGGDSSAVAPLLAEGVVQVCGNRDAFAAIKANGSVVTWGDARHGGNSSAVAALLTEGVVQVCRTDSAFAARKANGSVANGRVVTWGSDDHGGDSSGVAALLTEGMVCDLRDRIYVADCGSHRVQIFDRSGKWLWGSDLAPLGNGTPEEAGFHFRSPTAMCVSVEGLVYVASDHCVQVF
ncbi:unnamed protein product [Polarella glacialis]|uniref:Uncharacterized protein n=1 Tax=Polarella glacialis TaxID=89957 RepID=A0A813FYA6_POLGL|nr:unnamed protein product [Polarella glacialis]